MLACARCTLASFGASQDYPQLARSSDTCGTANISGYTCKGIESIVPSAALWQTADLPAFLRLQSAAKVWCALPEQGVV